MIKKIYKDIKISQNELFIKRKNRKFKRNYSQPFISQVDHFFSIFDKARLEEKENKKKWLYPEGFISCIGKYSGIQL